MNKKDSRFLTDVLHKELRGKTTRTTVVCLEVGKALVSAERNGHFGRKRQQDKIVKWEKRQKLLFGGNGKRQNRGKRAKRIYSVEVENLLAAP